MFFLWDKVQIVIIITRIKEANNTIFLVDYADTLDALIYILKMTMM